MSVEPSDRHINATYKVCRRCCSKTKNNSKKLLTTLLKQRYTDHFKVSLTSDSTYHPKVLCSHCEIFLFKLAKGNALPKQAPPQYPFQRHYTRNLVHLCEQGLCEICNVAFSNNKFTAASERSTVLNKKGLKGRPSEPCQDSPDYTLCKFCGSKLGPGFSHDCNRESAVSNFGDILRKRKLEDQVASSVIRSNVNSDGECHLSNIRGKATKVSLNPESTDDKDNFLSLLDLKKMKRTQGGSSNKGLKENLAVVRASETTNVKVTSYDLLSRERTSLLGDLVSIDEVVLNASTLKYVTNNKPTKVASFTDIPTVLKLWKPDLPDAYDIKLMADHGQEFFKICLIPIIPGQKANSTTDMLVVLAVQAPEHAQNLDKLFSLNWFRSLENFPGKVILTNDYKVSNQLVGVMIGAYPCIYCEWPSAIGFTDEPQVQRTRENITANYNKLQQQYGGDSKKYGKRCKGVFTLPSVAFGKPMDTLAPAELHLMEGIFHTIYLPFLKDLDHEQKKEVNILLTGRGIFPSKYHGGKYEGNEVRKILKLSQEFLQPIVKSDRQRKFINALVSFNCLVHACFGAERKADYISCISNFRDIYASTGLSVTYKVHVVVHHITQYFNNYTEPGQGLSIFSEQAGESAHHIWKRYWTRYKVRPQSEMYGERLKLCMIDFTYDRLPL